MRGRLQRLGDNSEREWVSTSHRGDWEMREQLVTVNADLGQEYMEMIKNGAAKR